MKRLICLLAVLSVLVGCAVTAYAADGNVLYTENAGAFVFFPGSEYSLSDLFPNFKGVMPGDSLEQKITVKNDASNDVKVDIYIRSLGAHEDSREFLSQMTLRVKKSEENDMAYMFDAAASETAQLSDWVCLGTLYSGGVVNLDVILDVPVTMGNEFQNKIGYLEWEFKAEEFPVEDTDPRPPQTRDETELGVLAGLMIVSAVGLVVILILIKRRQTEKGDQND